MAIDGTSGNDILNGTSGDDEINGLAGEDIINGLGGIDIINAGEDDDTIILNTQLPFDPLNFFFSLGTYNGGDGTDTLEVHNYDTTPGSTSAYRFGISSSGLGLSGVEVIDYRSTAETVLLVATWLHAVDSATNTAITFATPTTLIGGDGIDRFTLFASGGMGDMDPASSITIPDLTVSNWTSNTADPLSGDTVTLLAFGDSDYRLAANEANSDLVQILVSFGDLPPESSLILM